jgi:hypothetical protein
MKHAVQRGNSGYQLSICSRIEENQRKSLIEFRDFIYKNPLRTSQETLYVSATEPNRLMLFRETVAVYCENHTEHKDALFGGKIKGF